MTHSDSFHQIKTVLSDKIRLRADSIIKVALADRKDHIINNSGTIQIKVLAGKSPDLTTLIKDQLILPFEIRDGLKVERDLAAPPQILSTRLHQEPRAVSKTTERK